MAKEHPEYNNLEVVYSSDDEGNSYQKVFQTGVLAQFHSMKDYDLELVGIHSGDEHIDERDCNAIIIN